MSVSRRWSGENFQRSPYAWTATIEYDAAGYGSPNDAENAVMSFAGYSTDQNNPSKHPASPLMYFAGLSSRDVGFHCWIVTASFSTSPLGFVPNPNNPLNDPPVYQWQLGSSQEAVDQDAYGNAIVNTACVPMTGATRNFATATFIISRNEPAYNPAVALNYVNRVNSQAMTLLGQYTVGPGQVLLRSYQPVLEATQQSPYMRCQYVFEIKSPVKQSADSADGLFDSWKVRLINKGRVGWYTSSTGKKQRGVFGRSVNTIGFVECSEDLLLDKTGKPLKIPGEDSAWKIMDYTPALPTPADPIACSSPMPVNVAMDTDPTTGVVFLKFCMFPAIDFGALNL